MYVLFNLTGTPLMAKLSDAMGRRPIYVLNVSLFAVGSLVVASAPSFGVLLLGRAVQGLGAGGIFPVASAVIGDTFPAEKRGSALGLIGAVFGLAFLVGPILGGLLLMLGWRWLFLVNLPIAGAVILLSLRRLPTTRPGQRGPFAWLRAGSFDWPGMLCLGLLLAALTYGLNQIDTQRFASSISSPAVWPFLVAVLVLLPIFWTIEQRAEDPVLRLSLFKSRQVALVSALAAGSGLGEAAVVFVPALAVAAFGVTTSTASFMLLPAVVAMGIGAPLFGRMLDRLGSRTVVLLATGMLSAGMLVVGSLAINLPTFYLAAILTGLGLAGLLGASLRYVMLNEAPAAERAAAQGALTLFTSAGQLLGGATVGAVAASRGGGVPGYQAAYLLVGVVALGLTLLALGLKRRGEEMATARRHERTSRAESA
jgi:MFS family permease